MSRWCPRKVHRILCRELGLFSNHPYSFHQASRQDDLKDPKTYTGASARVSFCYCWRCMTTHVSPDRRRALPDNDTLVSSGSKKRPDRSRHRDPDPVFTDTELCDLLDRVERQLRSPAQRPSFRRYPTGIGRCSYATRRNQLGLLVAWCTTCGSTPSDPTNPYKSVPPVCTGRPRAGFIDSLGHYAPYAHLE